ncbi:MAG: ion channel [Planctomycetota bacterium]
MTLPTPHPPIDQRRPLTPAKAHGSLALLVGHLLVAPYGLREVDSAPSIALQTAFYLLLVFVLVGVATQRVQLVACLALIVAAAVIRVVAAADDRLAQAGADAALVIVGVIALVLSVRRVLLTPRVTPALISAAVSIYILAGVVWAIGFQALETLSPGSFRLPDAQLATAGDLYYFSFVTLTTLGYGDVSPVTPIARSCAILQAVFGQLFLVVLIGRLVSLQISPLPTTEGA